MVSFHLYLRMKPILSLRNLSKLSRTKLDVSRDLNVILSYIEQMINRAGFLERYFRPEGKMRDNVCALPVVSGKLIACAFRIVF